MIGFRFGRIAACAACCVGVAHAQDWPQWRGPQRDGKATGFQAPSSWPKELAKKWSVTVGDGVATPALVGDRLYVVGRVGEEEVVRCLEAATGKEIWKEAYPQEPATGPAGGYPGPRSSPAVADGKVVVLGVSGTLSCFDAKDGKVLWRKSDTKPIPRFSTSCSPVIVGDVCIVQLGSEESGMIGAFGLADGAEKWKYTEDGTTYSSPVTATIDGTAMVVALGRGKLVGLDAATGKTLWSAPFRAGYNACTPVVAGDLVIVSGGERGAQPFTKAFKVAKSGDGFSASEKWTNTEVGVQYNTPIVRDSMLFGLSNRDVFFCLDSATGKLAWQAPKTPGAAVAAAPMPKPGEGKGAEGKGGGKGGGKKGGRMGGRGFGGGVGYGSIVDAGDVLLALTPTMELIVFAPSKNKFDERARIKVASSATYAYPIASGNRLFVKDKESVSLLAVN